MKYSDIIFHMKSIPLWKEYEEYILNHRPEVPVFDPSDDNTHVWKYKSAQREGFDLALSLLNIKIEE